MSASDPPLPFGDEGVTLPVPTLRANDAVSPRALAETASGTGPDRYHWRRLLGAGGMGEVHLCFDAQLGRDVAMKVMQPSQGTAGLDRFVREARLQGQLEHPSIVPVYDLSTNAEGQTYFTMKRLQGKTLRCILDERLEGRAEALELYTRRRLLTLLSQLSQAVGFAHARGVVHRDLKPENIMLGDFGEIYLLDWGIARPVRVEGAEEAAEAMVSEETQVGVMVGTPGYMSPEQALGEPTMIGPPSDVYALGCVLFEILTGAMVHRGSTPRGWIASTLENPVASPHARHPEVETPPELDRICARATARSPLDRFENASVFSRAIEDFLDGERDAELRGKLAKAHLARAEESLTAVANGVAAEGERERGMRELGRALALDPGNERSLSLLGRLVLANADELPKAAMDELAQVELSDRRANNKHAMMHYLGWLAFIVMFHFLGTKNQGLNAALGVGIASLVAYGLWMSASGNVGRKFMRVAIGATFLLTAATSVFVGPLFVVAGTAATASAGFMVSLRANAETKYLLLALSVASFLVPFLLSLAGIIPNPYSFVDGSLLITSTLFDLSRPGLVYFVLLLSGLAQQLASYHMVGSATDKLLKAERRNFALAYRLRQLLPGSA